MVAVSALANSRSLHMIAVKATVAGLPKARSRRHLRQSSGFQRAVATVGICNMGARSFICDNAPTDIFRLQPTRGPLHVVTHRINKP